MSTLLSLMIRAAYPNFYKTEIQFGMESVYARQDTQVAFLPYVGISPTRFDELFSWRARKADDDVDVRRERTLDGAIVDWESSAKASKVRREVITNDALYSDAHRADIKEHERLVIKQYEEDVLNALSAFE